MQSPTTGVNPPPRPPSAFRSAQSSYPVVASSSWFERNWKWLISLIVVVCFMAFGLAIWGFLSLFKSSDAYQGALIRVKSSPAVIEALGDPVKDGLFFTGQINIVNDTGSANLSFSVSGPKGSGTAFAEAKLLQGQWRYDVLVVSVKGRSERIDLADKPIRKRGEITVPEVEASDGVRETVNGPR